MQIPDRRILPAIPLFLVVAIAGCNDGDGTPQLAAANASEPSAYVQKQASVTLTFGVYQSDKATEMYRKFAPVIGELAELLTVQYGQPAAIELRVFKTYEQAREALAQGEIDFARFGPASYVIVKQRNPGVRLLAMEHKKGRKRFKGDIVVRADSPYQSLADLKGARFAFGNPTSTIGRYLSQAELLRAGVDAGALASFEFLNRHDKVFRAVEAGDFDAGAVKHTTFTKLNSKGTLRVLVSFDNVTKPWVARSGIEPKLFEAIQQSLVNLSDPQVLQELKVSGFLLAGDDEYDFVRKEMAFAERFEGTSSETQ